MSNVRTVAVLSPQVPFFRGGAERLAESLVEQLQRRGYEATLVSVPFRWYPPEALADHCLAWRLLDLSESNGLRVDLVIGTKFPSYLARHERKVTWLVHQFRQVYDLLDTPYSEYGSGAEHADVRDLVRRMDAAVLPESRHVFAISRTVADRLRHWNGLEATALHPPPRGMEAFHPGETGRYLLSVGRLDATKRIDALIEALPFTEASLRCVIAGEGPEEPRLRALAEAAGVGDRVEFRGAVGFDEVVRLYADCLGVYFAPFQEDYGFVTVEAFLSHKPVVTAPDAGGPLEFVDDGETGVVVELEPEKLAERLRALADDPQAAAALGRAGHERVKHIGWDAVVDALVGAS